MNEALSVAVVDSPIGPLKVTTSERGLREVYMCDQRPRNVATSGGAKSDQMLERATSQLSEYFAGRRMHLEMPRDVVGTEFQRSVWDAIARIKPGRVTTYSALAEEIGRPNSARAVGRATGSNPLPIVVPCHRVLGADCSMTGFGGGLPRKRWLLEHEGHAFTERGKVDVGTPAHRTR